MSVEEALAKARELIALNDEFDIARELLKLDNTAELRGVSKMADKAREAIRVGE